MARSKTFKNVAVVHCWGAPCLCADGCTGCASCVNVCRFDAITLNEKGIAQVDRTRCTGCGMCVKACPQQIISVVPTDSHIQVLCSNHEAAKQAKTVCAVSCIACGACERACTSDAIHVLDNLAQLDPERCISCGMCATKCPRGVIHDVDGIYAESF